MGAATCRPSLVSMLADAAPLPITWQLLASKQLGAYVSALTAHHCQLLCSPCQQPLSAELRFSLHAEYGVSMHAQLLYF
jgi:hypothetical protein